MAKTLVHREAEPVRVPFLRGILTRSIQEAGLEFEDAYGVASQIREVLREEDEVTTEQIRALVLPLLEPFGEGVQARYRQRRSAVPTVLVRHEDGHEVPFSRGRHRVALAPCGLSLDQRGRIATHVHERLTRERVTEITSGDLGLLTYRVLEEEEGKEVAHRYAVWEEFRHTDRPLLLLVGGATGAGKSTITTELSLRLDIVRAQSTDMLREVMRMMIPARLLPVLHVSSFHAWEAIPANSRCSEDHDTQLANGYLTQLELISVACEAVFQRALHERVSLILEGVHVHPTLLDAIPKGTDAIIVTVMLGVLNPESLKRRLRGRGKKVPGRRAKRYLKHFEEIWRLQSFLLSEADKAGVPIVTDEDVDEASQEVLRIVLEELGRHFEGKPSKVFA